MSHDYKTGLVVKIVMVLCALAVLVSSALAAEKIALAGSKQGPEIFVQMGHSGDISTFTFSPDGKYILSGSDDKTLKLWDVSTGREIRTFKGHQGSIQSLAISPDGKYAVSGGFENNILIWDIEKCLVIKKIFIGKGKYGGGTKAVAFSPDGKYVAAAGYIDDKAFIFVRIYELRTGRIVNEFKGHKDYIESIAFSPDGNYIASGSGSVLVDNSTDTTVRVWDIKKGAEIKRFSGHTQGVMSVVFSPDGRYVASGSHDKTIKLWDIFKGNEPRTFQANDEVTSIAFSPDGKILLSAERFAIGIWDVFTGQRITTFKSGSLSGVKFTPDGRYVAISASKSIALWDIDSLTNDDLRHKSEFEVKLYGSSTGKLKTFGGDVESVNIVYFSSGGDKLKIAYYKKLLEYSLMSGANTVKTEIEDVYDLHSRDMRYMRIIEAKNKNPMDVIIDTKTDREIIRRPSKLEWPYISTFSADGKFCLVWNSQIDKFSVVDTKEFKEISSLPDKLSLNTFEFSPDGKTMVGSLRSSNNPAEEFFIIQWDINTGKQIKKFFGHAHIISSLTFTPDGKHLLSGSYDQTMKLWNVSTGKEIKTFKGHTDVIYSTSISANGELALSGCWDGSIKLWNTSSGKEIRTFKGHTDWVTQVSFSPDGKYVVSASKDGASRFWDIATGKEIAQFINFKDGEWIVITPEGYFNASPGGSKHLNVRVGNNVYSIDNFYEKFFNPVYVASVLQGKKVEAFADIRKGILSPPDVRITSPAPGTELSTDTLTVTVAAKDTGGGIDGIRLYHNGKAIGEDQRGLKLVSKGGETVKDYNVTLVDGVNTFRAVGFSKDRTESNPYEIVVKLTAPSKDVSLYVFAVGINNYKNPALNLNYAEPDARGITDFFKQQGKGLFKNLDVTAIYNEQATKQNIVSKLSQIQNINPQAAVLIYLAGHGENINDKWYFIPYELTYPEREEDVKTKGISSDELSGYIKNIKAQKILLLIDACKAGAVLIAFRGFEDRKALSQLSRSTGVHIVAASTKDQFAAEVKELGHGVFTYTLLQGLGGKAAGNGESVTVRKLMGYVEENLPEITEKYKQEAQYPVVDSRGMDFPLVIVK